MTVHTAYLLKSEKAAVLKREVPAEFMGLVPEVKAQGVTSVPTPLFPWTNGQVWYKTNGWHSGFWGFANNAVDIAPLRSSNPGSDYAVLAPTTGRITRVCQDTADQAVLKLDTEAGIFGFLHFRNSSIPGDVLNQDVPRGRYLGYLFDTGGSFSSYCGYGTGVHLHFALPGRDMTIDGNAVETIANSRTSNLTSPRTNARIRTLPRTPMGDSSAMARAGMERSTLLVTPMTTNSTRQRVRLWRSG